MGLLRYYEPSATNRHPLGAPAPLVRKELSGSLQTHYCQRGDQPSKNLLRLDTCQHVKNPAMSSPMIISLSSTCHSFSAEYPDGSVPMSEMSTKDSTGSCPTGSWIDTIRGHSLHLAHVSPVNGESQKLTRMSISSIARGGLDDVPSSIFYNYPVARNGPPGRWAHAAVAVGTSICVFGGIGMFNDFSFISAFT